VSAQPENVAYEQRQALGRKILRTGRDLREKNLITKRDTRPNMREKILRKIRHTRRETSIQYEVLTWRIGMP